MNIWISGLSLKNAFKDTKLPIHAWKLKTQNQKTLCEVDTCDDKSEIVQGRIQEFTKGEAVTAVDESLQITVCEFYFIFGELKWIFFQ